MVEAHQIEHSRVCGSDDTYCGHPHQDGIFNFGDGEVAVLHKHAPCDYASRYNVGHGVVHSRAKVVLQRSLDGGETWQEGHTVVWDETAPLEQRTAFLESSGPRPEIDLDDPDSAIYFGRTRRHVEENESNMQTFAVRSADRGRTWEEQPSIVSPPRSAQTNDVHKNGYPLTRLPDGLYVGVFYLSDTQPGLCLYGSGDNGLTWDYLSLIPLDESGFGMTHYPTLILAPNGRLQVYTVNVQGERNALQMTESVDGYSWSSQRPIVRLGTSPWLSRAIPPQSQFQLLERVYYRSPWPLLLRDGRIVVLFGRRKPPHGIGLIVSEDSGETWSDEIVLRDDAPSSDVGYPVATELDDGRIFTAYHYNSEPGGLYGGPRYIASTHFRLR